ncbi:MAG: ferredoxin [Candidatus Aminicenantales bacterium]|jgi:ferredoxin
MSYKVEIERPLCIACENCVAICPEFWEMAGDGLSHLIDSTGVGENEELEMDDVKCNIAAAESCPVTCIHVFNEGKKLIS